jgi:hypothetical protein
MTRFVMTAKCSEALERNFRPCLLDCWGRAGPGGLIHTKVPKPLPAWLSTAAQVQSSSDRIPLTLRTSASQHWQHRIGEMFKWHQEFMPCAGGQGSLEAQVFWEGG